MSEIDVLSEVMLHHIEADRRVAELVEARPPEDDPLHVSPREPTGERDAFDALMRGDGGARADAFRSLAGPQVTGVSVSETEAFASLVQDAVAEVSGVSPASEDDAFKALKEGT
jgi:hypothetical protein